MKIIIAKHIGFCSGVKRAINIANQSLKKDPKPIQFLGELVHNEKVIDEIKNKGGKFISEPKQVLPGTLITRAHGIPPSVKKGLKQDVLARETTCPLVTRAQNKAEFLFKQGYQVIIIGDKDHPETQAIKAQVKEQAIVVENQARLRELPNFKKIGVVCQTTQDLKEVNKLLKILKEKCQELKWFNTICPEVLARQKELGRILEKSEAILVIGSKRSANTSRLVEIVKKTKKPVWRVNSADELKKSNFQDISVLGVVSGTSTPNWLIKKVIDRLKNF